MSENPTGPGGNGPAHTAAPVQEPSGVEDLPDGTGQEAPNAAQPNVASSLLNAVLEGNSAVVTFLAIVTAIVIGGLLIAFSSPTVLHALSHLFSALRAAGVVDVALLVGFKSNRIRECSSCRSTD